MNDPGLSNLLKWGIANSTSTDSTNSEAVSERSQRGHLDPEVLASLFGGPSDADRMKDAMAAIITPEVDLKNKLIAFDNFEQLIENLDNANNMESLGLWEPLVGQLDNEEPEMQVFSAWCLGTAVQNNIKCQERCLATGAVPKLVDLALHGSTAALRKKAVYALSSEVRNYQAALDAMVKDLPTSYRGEDKLDAEDMAAVDILINRLRDEISAQDSSS